MVKRTANGNFSALDVGVNSAKEDQSCISDNCELGALFSYDWLNIYYKFSAYYIVTLLYIGGGDKIMRCNEVDICSTIRGC